MEGKRESYYKWPWPLCLFSLSFLLLQWIPMQQWLLHTRFWKVWWILWLWGQQWRMELQLRYSTDHYTLYNSYRILVHTKQSVTWIMCTYTHTSTRYHLIYCAGGRGSSLGLAVGVSVVVLLCCIIIIAGCCCGGYSYNRKSTRTRTAPLQHVATATAVTAVTSPTTTSSHVAEYSDELQRAKADYPPPYTPTVVSSPPWFQVSLYITQCAYMIWP